MHKRSRQCHVLDEQELVMMCNLKAASSTQEKHVIHENFFPSWMNARARIPSERQASSQCFNTSESVLSFLYLLAVYLFFVQKKACKCITLPFIVERIARNRNSNPNLCKKQAISGMKLGLS